MILIRRRWKSESVKRWRGIFSRYSRIQSAQSVESHEAISGRCFSRGCLLQGETLERYPYYFQLLDEIRVREEFRLRIFGTKKKSDVRYKVGDMGVQQAEPRLEPKKHRRQSRKTINPSILNMLDELDDDENLLADENDPILRALRNESGY